MPFIVIVRTREILQRMSAPAAPEQEPAAFPILTDLGPAPAPVSEDTTKSAVGRNATALMLNGFLKRSYGHSGPLRPKALVCVPSRATWVERRSVAAAMEARRPRAIVTLVDEPVAAAAGSGVDLAGGAGAFVVDLGGGTTEIAVVSGGRVVRAQSLRVAGNAMDDAIMHAARSELGLILGRKAATSLKMELGLTGGALGWAEAVGIDAAQRTPRVERIPGKLIATALEHTVAAIISSIQEILSDIPPGIAEDVVGGRIRLAGGGALLPGLVNRIESSADIGAVVEIKAELTSDPADKRLDSGAHEVAVRTGQAISSPVAQPLNISVSA